MTNVESCALRLLATAAAAVLVVCLVVLPAGPSESTESLSWVLALFAALPAGLLVAARQEQRFAAAAPAAASRGLAIGLAALTYGLLLRHGGAGNGPDHALLALAALSALAAPFFAAWVWRDPSDRAFGGAPAIAAAASLVVLALLFLPAPALRLGNLLPALALAALAFMLLRIAVGRSLGAERRLALDVVLCGVLALVVIQLPDLGPYAANVVHHQGFFLGPANDVLHGRPMLDGAWSQYGVGAIDTLALAFAAVPIGYGTLSLIVVVLTTLQYLCVYVTLRLAGLGQLLTAIVVLVAAAGNLFWPIAAYPVFPSASALRFGLPYAIVLLAVVGCRYPAQARRAWVGMLTVLAISAVWSFETFVYCAGTYGFLVIVEAVHREDEVVRRVARGAVLGLAVSVAAVALYSALTLAFAGGADWGPYVEYLRLYSSAGFGQLPVQLFSLGPPMAAAIFLSATTLLWLVRDRPQALSPPMRAAIAGFTGMAIVTFTYYLGRSHPNNLLNILVPLVALGGLWLYVLLQGRPLARWRAAAAGTLLTAAAMIAVAAWPAVESKWGDTGLSLALSGKGELGGGFERLADNPVLDQRAPAAVGLLDGRPSDEPIAVLAEPELTTEILLRAGRNNLLPISHPSEDVLIESSAGRVEAASERVPAGTLLLLSPAPGSLNALQELALSTLQRRFELSPVARTAAGIELVRLVPH
jgi:hypothetical protein